MHPWSEAQPIAAARRHDTVRQLSHERIVRPVQDTATRKETASVPSLDGEGIKGRGDRANTRNAENRARLRSLVATAGDRPTGRSWHLRHHHRCRAWYQSRRMFRPYGCDLWNPPSSYRRNMPRRYTADTPPKTNNH